MTSSDLGQQGLAGARRAVEEDPPGRLDPVPAFIIIIIIIIVIIINMMMMMTTMMIVVFMTTVLMTIIEALLPESNLSRIH